nr:zinc carboxypeptidase [Actinomycetota bacterium]
WNAASGNSAGWQEWEVDLSDFAGQQIELSISYTSDWSVQGLGVFVDDIVGPGGQGSTSFESGMDGWTVSGSPPGSDPNPNDWVRTTGEAVGYEEGATITTPESIYMGFGFEGISSVAKRNSVMGRSMDHLLP